MILNFILIFLGAIVFLNSLHFLAKDDFTLLRKNITLEQVFNYAFLIFFVGLFFARLYFVLLHFKKLYLNPLVFLHIIYFPGLSLYGAFIGACIFFYLYLKRKNVPLLRLFDIFSLAFLTTLPLSLVPFFLTKTFSIFLVVNIVSFLIYILTIYMLLKLFLKGQTKLGSTGFNILFLFSAVTFVQDFFVKQETIFFIFSLQQIIIAISIIALLILSFFRRRVKI